MEVEPCRTTLVNISRPYVDGGDERPIGNDNGPLDNNACSRRPDVVDDGYDVVVPDDRLLVQILGAQCMQLPTASPDDSHPTVSMLLSFVTNNHALLSGVHHWTTAWNDHWPIQLPSVKPASMMICRRHVAFPSGEGFRGSSEMTEPADAFAIAIAIAVFDSDRHRYRGTEGGKTDRCTEHDD